MSIPFLGKGRPTSQKGREARLIVTPMVWDGGHTSCPPSSHQLAQGSERRAQLGSEELRLFPGGEVPALVGLVEVDQVGVDLLGPAARCLKDLAWEDGESNRQRKLRRLLAGRKCSTDALGFLP